MSNKVRVAFDASSTRGRKTGIGVYTEQLVHALQTYAPNIATVLLNDAAEVDLRTDKRIWREQFLLPRLARSANVDLLHLTGFAAPLRSQVPIVLTVMDLIGVLFSQNFPPASRFYWSQYLPFTLRAVKHIITLSEHTKRDVVRLTRTPPQNITVIPPGLHSRFRPIPDSHALEETRARLKLPARFFLFVSTLEPRKGVDTLLHAYERIAPYVNEHLVIVGKRGWYYETLLAQIRAIGAERVHVADYVADEDLPRVYNLATAFVFPSRYEGFGYTPLEAMACGTPIISSNAASLPEVIDDAGILVAPNDITSFAHAMETLASKPTLRAELHQRGLHRAQQFTWQRAALVTAELYVQIALNQKS